MITYAAVEKKRCSGRVGVPSPTVAADGGGTPSLPAFATAAKDPKSLAPPPLPKPKLTYNEKRELDALPAAIEALEHEIAEIESALADPSIFAKDNARAMALTARLPQAREELDAAETRWLELSERS